MKQKVNIAELQLKIVEKADLSNFDAETNTYYIPQRKDIKLEIDKCYLIHIKPQFFANDTIKTNWNRGTSPQYSDMKIEVAQIMAKMVKVVGVGYDPETKQDISSFWTGWLPTDDIEIKQKL